MTEAEFWMLAGSALGTVLALGICRLFDAVRAKIAETVGMAGLFLTAFMVFSSLFSTNIWSLCFFLCLFIGGIVWTQRFHPAKTSLTSAALFGILVVEVLLAGVVLWLVNRVLLPQLVNQMVPLPRVDAIGTLFAAFNVTLILVLLLEESLGPLRRRVRW